MKKLNSKRWLVALQALSMLIFSLPGSATDYVTTFASVEKEFLTDVSGDKTSEWTYEVTEGVNGPYFSQGGMTGLDFSLPLFSSDQNYLSMTSMRSFYGSLKSIKVVASNDGQLDIFAYSVMKGENDKYLCKLEYSPNDKGYVSDALPATDLNGQNIKLVFSVASTYTPGQGSSTMEVYGFSSVTISVTETLEPLAVDQTISFDPSKLGFANLSNYIYKGILFTLNVTPDGDGIETEGDEGVIYMATPLSDATVAGVAGNVNDKTYLPGSDEYANAFSGGLTMLIPPGSGKIIIEVDTEEDYVLHVKVGNKAPAEICSTERRVYGIPYKVTENTYVYIYLTQASNNSRPKTRIGKRATAHGRVYSMKCASGITVFGDANDNGGIDKLDVKAIADYIMGKEPAGFNFWLADVNGDGVVNVADLVKVVELLLGPML